MKPINGKVYPMWSQFCGPNTKWVGGLIYDHDMGDCIKKPLKEIRLEPNGNESAMLVFDIGESDPWFSDVKAIGRIEGKGPNGGLLLGRTYGGHFEIVERNPQ